MAQYDFQVVGKGGQTCNFVMQMGGFEEGKVVVIEKQTYVVRGVQEVGLDLYRYRLECEGQQNSNFPGYHEEIGEEPVFPDGVDHMVAARCLAVSSNIALSSTVK